MPFLDYDVEIRRVICSTNAIESINARYRRAIRARGHFPTGLRSGRSERAAKAAIPCRSLSTSTRPVAPAAPRLGITDDILTNDDILSQQDVTKISEMRHRRRGSKTSGQRVLGLASLSVALAASCGFPATKVEMSCLKTSLTDVSRRSLRPVIWVG